MANLTTYGCFGDGTMCKLNKNADLSKVQQWVKFEDIVEASLNSPASPVQQTPAVCKGMPHGSCKGKQRCDPNNPCFTPA